MAQANIKPDFQVGNDVTSLFSRFGEFATGAARETYQEVHRQDAAYEAACRWPLLAEIQNLDVVEDATLAQTLKKG
jgi:hypothetical protein